MEDKGRSTTELHGGVERCGLNLLLKSDILLGC